MNISQLLSLQIKKIKMPELLKLGCGTRLGSLGQRSLHSLGDHTMGTGRREQEGLRNGCWGHHLQGFATKDRWQSLVKQGWLGRQKANQKETKKRIRPETSPSQWWGTHPILTRLVTIGSRSLRSRWLSVMRSALSVLMRCRRSRMYRAEVNSSNLGEGSSALGLPLMSDVWIWTQPKAHVNSAQYHTRCMLVNCIRVFTKIDLKASFYIGKQNKHKIPHLTYVGYS